MEVITRVVGPLQTNTYMVLDEETKSCVIIDPAAEGKHIIDEIDGLGYEVKALLVTHGHFDHIDAVNQLRTYYQVPVVTHELEGEMMADGQKNFSLYFIQRSISAKADTYVEDGEVIDFGGDLQFKCIEVPGHTAHSICYYVEKSGLLFTGDTLMTGAIGRSDMYDGPSDMLLNTILEKLIVLPGDVKTFPGHGPSSTIEREKGSNPFIYKTL